MELWANFGQRYCFSGCLLWPHGKALNFRLPFTAVFIRLRNRVEFFLDVAVTRTPDMFVLTVQSLSANPQNII